MNSNDKDSNKTQDKLEADETMHKTVDGLRVHLPEVPASTFYPNPHNSNKIIRAYGETEVCELDSFGLRSPRTELSPALSQLLDRNSTISSMTVITIATTITINNAMGMS